LTLILGARCIYGVVIVGDSKITNVMGTLLRYEPKYAGALRNVLFGYSGAVHMFKVFERYVVGDVVILRDSKDKYTREPCIGLGLCLSTGLLILHYSLSFQRCKFE
jgi:hypothetical protein